MNEIKKAGWIAIFNGPTTHAYRTATKWKEYADKYVSIKRVKLIKKNENG